MCSLLQPLLQDLQTLKQQGVHVQQLGTFPKGTIQCVVADNLSMAGFVENFSSVLLSITACHANSQTTEVKGGKFKLRTSTNDM